MIPTQLRGPLPKDTVGLLLPRSHAPKKGIFVIQGIIDSDFTGIIKVQVWTYLSPKVNLRISISQLVLLPYVSVNKLDNYQGDHGFGSTIVAATIPVE